MATPAPKPLAQWRLEDALAAAQTSLPDDYAIARAQIEHEDHWHHGRDWVGSRTGDPATDGWLLRQREPQFVQDDVLTEGVDNRTNGLIGQEADVALVPLNPSGEDGAPSETQTSAADDLLRVIAAWWDKKGFWSVVRTALNRLHYATRCEMRPFVAEGNIVRVQAAAGQPVTTRLPAAKNFEDALDKVEVEAPAPDQCIRYIDPITQRPVGIIVREVNGRQTAEVWTVNPETQQTEVRLFGTATPERSGGTGEVQPSFALNLQGRLPLGEARGSRIITKSARRLQAQLNLATTYTSRTVEFSGSRERFFGNVEPPGIWLPYPPTNTRPLDIDTDSIPGKTFYKHSHPWVIGADVSNALVGLRVRTTRPDGTKAEEYATPSITALDPVDPVFTTNAAQAITGRLYRRMRQGHLGLSGTVEASGTAYQQARAQFEADLNAIKGGVEGMIRDVLESALAMAGLMSSEAASILTQYRVQVTLKISAGPVMPDEARLAVELRNARAISTSEMMVRVGVEDPVAMQDDIDADPLLQADYWTKLTAAIQVMTQNVPNLTASGAAFLLKLPPEIVEVFRTGDVPGAPAETQPVRAAEPPVRAVA